MTKYEINIGGVWCEDGRAVAFERLLRPYYRSYFEAQTEKQKQECLNSITELIEDHLK
jgi:hypothetical protein